MNRRHNNPLTSQVIPDRTVLRDRRNAAKPAGNPLHRRNRLTSERVTTGLALNPQRQQSLGHHVLLLGQQQPNHRSNHIHSRCRDIHTPTIRSTRTHA
jgi:hypothetical protein